MSFKAAVTGDSVRLSYIPLIQNTDSMPKIVGEGVRRSPGWPCICIRPCAWNWKQDSFNKTKDSWSTCYTCFLFDMQTVCVDCGCMLQCRCLTQLTAPLEAERRWKLSQVCQWTMTEVCRLYCVYSAGLFVVFCDKFCSSLVWNFTVNTCSVIVVTLKWENRSRCDCRLSPTW